MDVELRNSLWNALSLLIWSQWEAGNMFDRYPRNNAEVDTIVRHLWVNFFKWQVDSMPSFSPGNRGSAHEILKSYFLKASWWEVYDFIEFIVQNSESQLAAELVKTMNVFLERESAGYRFIAMEIVEITDKTEIAEIETAIEKTTKAVRQHLERSLALLSDRANPDFRNSVKESISAVESISQYVTGQSGATLGDTLKILKRNTAIHPALESAFSRLYGYTSDAGGIRHALSDDESVVPTYAEAKFMLVACSAFCNFLFTVAAKS